MPPSPALLAGTPDAREMIPNTLMRAFMIASALVGVIEAVPLKPAVADTLSVVREETEEKNSRAARTRATTAAKTRACWPACPT